MRRLMLTAVVLAVIVLAVAVSRPTAAQGSDSQCDLNNLFKTAHGLWSVGNDKRDLAALMDFRDQISAAVVACNGLTFSGTQVAKIIGPVEVPDGTYKITATTQGFLAVIIKGKNASCQVDSSVLVNVSQGDANGGYESMATFQGNCKFYLEPSNISAPWTLTFELMG